MITSGCCIILVFPHCNSGVETAEGAIISSSRKIRDFTIGGSNTTLMLQENTNRCQMWKRCYMIGQIDFTRNGIDGTQVKLSQESKSVGLGRPIAPSRGKQNEEMWPWWCLWLGVDMGFWMLDDLGWSDEQLAYRTEIPETKMLFMKRWWKDTRSCLDRLAFLSVLMK